MKNWRNIMRESWTRMPVFMGPFGMERRMAARVYRLAGTFPAGLGRRPGAGD
jgi:hypothetical protein